VPVMIALAVLVFSARVPAAEKKPETVAQDKIDKVTAATPAKPYAKPAESRKIIIFTMTKGFRHGSIPLAAKAFEIMGQKTGAFEATQSDQVADFAADKLKGYDAIIIDQCTGDLFKEEDLKTALLEFVKGGKGIVGVHAATDCFYGWKEFGEMMGGYFAGHPFGRISIKLDDPASPLNAMFDRKGFEIRDEIYTFKDPYSREKLHILMSIDWENAHLKGGNRADNDYALSWIHEYGKGRAFYCAFGHDDAIWWNPKILAHYLAGIQYAIGDLKADATPTAKLSPAPTPARGPDLEAKKAAAEPKTVTIYAAPEENAAKTDAQGWIPLFDGKDLSQWMNAAGGEPGKGWVVEDGAMVRASGSGDIWTKQRFGNFVLDLEFKTEGNSGVFIRTDNPKDCVQTGIEMQVEKSGGKEQLGRNDVGSIYDCLAPSKNPFKDGDWNHVVITANGSKITIVANGVQIIDMDLDKWTDARKNPDGSANKFNKPLKDFKRDGHIGLQDHGAKVMYRNIKIKPVAAAAGTGSPGRK
jgi:hypothetical protein